MSCLVSPKSGSASDGCYYTNYRRQQHKLGETEAEARKAFYKLLASNAPAPDKANLTVRSLCDQFLAFKAGPAPEMRKLRKGKNAGKEFFVRRSLNVLRHVLQVFCDKFGGQRATRLSVGSVREWIDACDRWNDSSKARPLFCCALPTCSMFNLLPVNEQE